MSVSTSLQNVTAPLVTLPLVTASASLQNVTAPLESEPLHSQPRKRGRPRKEANTTDDVNEKQNCPEEVEHKSVAADNESIVVLSDWEIDTKPPQAELDSKSVSNKETTETAKEPAIFGVTCTSDNEHQNEADDGNVSVDSGSGAESTLRQRRRERKEKLSGAKARDTIALRLRMGISKRQRCDSSSSAEDNKERVLTGLEGVMDSAEALEQREHNRELQRARQVLFTRMTVRELRDFLNDAEGITKVPPPTQIVPVRRPNKRKRPSDPALRERPSFPFVLVQIGEYNGYLPSNVAPHPQQRNRPNAIGLNPAQRRMVYEFTVFNKEGELCYNVWTVDFAQIEGMHFTEDLVYFRLNHPAMVSACYRGAAADLCYDVTSGQRRSVVLHYFRLLGDSERLRESLLRYDREFFSPRLMTYHEFFKEVLLSQQLNQIPQQVAPAPPPQPLPITHSHNNHNSSSSSFPFSGFAMPTVPHTQTNPSSVVQSTRPPALTTNQLHQLQHHIPSTTTTPAAPSFYSQSQYNVQNACENRNPLSAPSVLDYQALQGGHFDNLARSYGLQQFLQNVAQQNHSAHQTNQGVEQHRNDYHQHNRASLECRNSDYFPGAMASQASMRRDSEYLLGGLSGSQYALPHPGQAPSHPGFLFTHGSESCLNDAQSSVSSMYAHGPLQSIASVSSGIFPPHLHSHNNIGAGSQLALGLPDNHGGSRLNLEALTHTGNPEEVVKVIKKCNEEEENQFANGNIVPIAPLKEEVVDIPERPIKEEPEEEAVGQVPHTRPEVITKTNDYEELGDFMEM